MTADQDDLAARLTPAQKRALLWLPADGAKKRTEKNIGAAFSWMRMNGDLHERTLIGGTPHFNATPLGLSVRAIIAKEAGHE